MKVLMIARDNLYSSPGGDTIQIDMTAKYLHLLNIEVDIKLTGSIIKYNNYDLIHFFNIIRPDDILPHINHNIPFVVSTIFVDYSEYERKNRGFFFKILSSGQIEYIKAIARWIKNGDKIKSKYYILNGHKKSIKKIIAKSKMLLPNSHNEFNRLEKYIGKINTPYKKIVNAINTEIFNSDVEENIEYKNYIISVGRIEGRKNQLNLIKATIELNLPLVIIGKSSPNHKNYYNECKKTALGHNISFIEHISHEELVKIYKATKVHVLASWFETTGLSSLEAGIMDCNIVITKKGDTEEYFKDYAFYCEPDNIESIKKTIKKAYDSPTNKKLSDYISKNYTWKKTAKQTFITYKKVLTKSILYFYLINYDLNNFILL